MKINPYDVLNSLNNRNINKKYAIQLLSSLLHYCEDDSKREKCLKIIKMINFEKKIIIPVIEEILTTDLNGNIRFLALKIIEGYIDQNLLPLLEWLLLKENLYENEILIIELFGKFSKDIQKRYILKKLRHILGDKEDLSSKLQIDDIKEDFTDIAKNLITLNHLINKFEGLRYEIKNGYLIELDFSHFNKKLTNWKVRENLKDFSEIHGVKYLRKLKRIGLFPSERVFKNEIVLRNQIELLKSLAKEKYKNINDIAKSLLLNLEKKQLDLLFKKFKVTKNSFLYDSKSSLHIINIIKNFIIISYLKEKYKNLKYGIKDGCIEKLILRNYKIIKIPEIIDELKNLKTLKFIKCHIYNIPDFLEELTNLKILILSNNLIENIPPSLMKITELRHLDLSLNNIQEIPINIRNLVNLTSLNLKNNKIKRVPDSLGNLTSLRKLNLRGNFIQFLPESLGGLRNLQVLYVNNNKIKKIPKSFSKLRNLRKLSIYDNYIDYIPDFMTNLPELRFSKIKLKNYKS
jgi:hypothetical protein